jgi:hypothetical protein
MTYIEEIITYSFCAFSYDILFINIDITMKHPKDPLNYMVLPATVLSCYLATSMTLDVLGIYKKNEPSQ